ncbi:MAG: Patatin-like phospholipase [Firmicutes bacterium ADurb.Bin182]|nr:MAG: Patatin-like phospholipase [Firmicutes bacterium ADurb.Bin182]
MDVNLVFEGGGVLGIYYAGAYKALKEYGYTVKRCAGTSAGAIVSSLIMAGYSPDELENIIDETDFKPLVKKTKMCSMPLIGKPLSIIYNKGVYDSRIIEDWVGGLLEKKGVSTFGDVMRDGRSDLKIIAADITRSKMLVLPDDLAEYGIAPESFSIARAASMSSSIPYFFTPVMLKDGERVNYIVNGGLLSGFPIWIFDEEGDPNITLGIKIKNPETNTSRGKRDILSYTKDMISAPINEDESNFIRNKDLVRTIIIDYEGQISSTDFANINASKKAMVRSGYDSAARFLENFKLESLSASM